MNCYPCRWTNLLPMSPAVQRTDQAPRTKAPGLRARIVPLCSLLAPCQPGASTPGITHLFPDGPLDSREILPHLMLPVRPVVAAERSPVVQVVPNPAALEHVRETVRFLAALPGT